MTRPRRSLADEFVRAYVVAGAVVCGTALLVWIVVAVVRAILATIAGVQA